MCRTYISTQRRSWAASVVYKRQLKKTTWPWESDPKVKGFKKFRELWGSTLVVLIAMVFLGAFVASFDIFLHSVVNYLIQLAI